MFNELINKLNKRPTPSVADEVKSLAPGDSPSRFNEINISAASILHRSLDQLIRDLASAVGPGSNGWILHEKDVDQPMEAHGTLMDRDRDVI